MRFLSSILAALALGDCAYSAVTSSLIKRQASCGEISYYFKLVNTALFSVNYVRTYNHRCDLDLIPLFNAQGYDGLYALDIICLIDGGNNIFGSTPLNVVNDDLIVTLIGLFDAAISTVGPARTLSCVNLNTTILEDLGLPSNTIKNYICDNAPCGSDNNGTTSSSSTAATSSATKSSRSLGSTGSLVPSLSASSATISASISSFTNSASRSASFSSDSTMSITASASSSAVTIPPPYRYTSYHYY